MNFRMLIVALVACAAMAQAGGKTVTVWQNSGETTRGELLWLDNSVILITPLEGASDAELLASPASLLTIPTEKAMKITTEGHSYILAGLGAGAAVGLVVGVIAANREPDSGIPIAGPILVDAPMRTADVMTGFAVGALAGLLVGMAVSSGDHAYEMASPADLGQLRLLARYRGSCPLLPRPQASQ